MRRIALNLALSVAAFASPAFAQRPDSARVRPGATPSLQLTENPGPPLSPRRAFLSSLILPGYGQSRLDRPHAAMLFSAIEIFSLGMASKAAMDLREVKSAPKDSVVSTYRIDPFSGKAILDPKTGQPIPATYIKSRFDQDRVKARRVHYEDWIAAIVFNHLFSGADAWVAANLADFNANVNVTAVGRGIQVAARIAW